VVVSRSSDDGHGCESVRASMPIRASGLASCSPHRLPSPPFTPTTQVSPASTLHNWKDEVSQFLPHFRLLPYWGGLNDRKQLRKFLDNRQLYCANASFHVVVTSYQLLVSDEKYFKPIKWQYMILDEAQVLTRFPHHSLNPHL
jgi:SNF2 family DNA or RNA helicase